MRVLHDLLARVEAASGPDREIDLALCISLRHPGEFPAVLAEGWTAYLSESAVSDRVMVRARNEAGEDGPLYSWPRPPLTASLDAALALVERQVGENIDAPQMLHEALEDMANGGWRTDQPMGPQIALYLLAAMLRALIAQGDAPGLDAAQNVIPREEPEPSQTNTRKGAGE